MTHDFTVAAAQTLAKLNSNMTFIFVSGAGADSSAKSRTMWARVKGTAENAVLRMPFKAACVFRPAKIQPLNGIQSRARLYRVFLAPLYPLLKALLPNYAITTEQLARAMITVAKQGAAKRVLESRDIVQVV